MIQLSASARQHQRDVKHHTGRVARYPERQVSRHYLARRGLRNARTRASPLAAAAIPHSTTSLSPLALILAGLACPFRSRRVHSCIQSARASDQVDSKCFRSLVIYEKRLRWKSCNQVCSVCHRHSTSGNGIDLLKNVAGCQLTTSNGTSETIHRNG
ncbi:hypothetical protein K456DRAFT_213041 [Colletotrichum gloeosporioides 23]|nr:hypothetical protein K456DRAFT_213041 [Colletotrichum gloeosporioides 23]